MLPCLSGKHRLTSNPTFWSRLLIATLAVGTFGCGGPSSGPGSDRANDRSQIEALAIDCKKTAAMARDAALVAFQTQTIDLYDVVSAIEAAFEADSISAKTPAERIDAHRQRVDTLTQLEAPIESLYRNGKNGGEANQYGFIKTKRQLADIALVRACTAEHLPVPKLFLRDSLDDPVTMAEP